MPETYTLKVDDEEMQMEHQLVVAHDILELAEKNQVITGKPEDYFLKSLIRDNQEYRNDDEVDIEKDNQFIAILDAPAPVA